MHLTVKCLWQKNCQYLLLLCGIYSEVRWVNMSRFYLPRLSDLRSQKTKLTRDLRDKEEECDAMNQKVEMQRVDLRKADKIRKEVRNFFRVLGIGWYLRVWKRWKDRTSYLRQKLWLNIILKEGKRPNGTLWKWLFLADSFSIVLNIMRIDLFANTTDYVQIG